MPHHCAMAPHGGSEGLGWVSITLRHGPLDDPISGSVGPKTKPRPYLGLHGPTYNSRAPFHSVPPNVGGFHSLEWPNAAPRPEFLPPADPFALSCVVQGLGLPFVIMLPCCRRKNIDFFFVAVPRRVNLSESERLWPTLGVSEPPFGGLKGQKTRACNSLQ